MKPVMKMLFLFLANVLLFIYCNAQQLTGSVGNSSQWGSGWIDLDTITNFNPGDILVIRVGGTAEQVLVRLLSQGGDHSSSKGLLDGIHQVPPPDNVIRIVLDQKYRKIAHISVHGNSNPFGISLGKNNGPATLLSVSCQRFKSGK
jgi:hypothetical protein